MHPHDATGVDIRFQRRYRRTVLRKEIGGERVVPVKNDYAILAEVEPSQLRRCKLSVSVPVTSDGILKNRKAPWIVRVEQRELVRRCLAIAERVVHGVGTQSGVPAVRREAEGHP